MIVYLFNFSLCSALLLAAYHLLLKNKAMYRFNRFYLLFSVVFSLMAPLIAVKQGVAPLPSIKPLTAELIAYPQAIGESHNNTPVTANTKANYLNYSIALYSLVSLMLLFRFARNLYAIHITIAQNERLSYQNASLVLIEDSLTPHTFLNYIFLNKSDYRAKRIEKEVLGHELAHARQLHSADIIFIELVQAAFWFNPLIILYRKAIQLNHEFIADAAVLDKGQSVSVYQRLLLSKLTETKSLNITSQFNYSITKKRLIMMSKTTSATIAWLTRAAIVPVIAIAFMLFCNKTAAQQEMSVKVKSDHVRPGKTAKPAPSKLTTTPVEFPSNGYPYTKEGISEDLMKEYNNIATKYIPDNHQFITGKITETDRNRLEELYKQMSLVQQQQQNILFIYPGPLLQQVKPTQLQLDEWKKTPEYGVWINEKRIKNSELTNHRPDEFGQVVISRLTPFAVKHDGFHKQVDLMTVDYYNKYRRDAEQNRHKARIMFRRIAPTNAKS